MIPFSDDIPTKKTPYVVIGLIIINLLVFLYEISLPEFELQDFFLRFGLTVENFPSLSLITFNFLHGGFFHIFFNMLFLWVFGNNVEDRFGSLLFTVFYLLAGAASGVIQLLVAAIPGVPIIGASGAIAAVLGAYLIMFPQARIKTLVILFIFVTIITLPAVVVIGLWFLGQLLSGALSLEGAAFQGGGVAYWGHIGGFSLGIIFMILSKFFDLIRGTKSLT